MLVQNLRLLCLTMLFSVVQSEDGSVALKRQSMIFNEPPFEIHYQRDNHVTEHFITQRLDNFDHQNKETFQMVKLLGIIILIKIVWVIGSTICNFILALFAEWRTFQTGWTNFHSHRWWMENKPRTYSIWATHLWSRQGIRWPIDLHRTSILWKNNANQVLFYCYWNFI